MSGREDSGSSTVEGGRQELEVLAEQYFRERRHGRAPDLEELAARHPDLADEIRELFPTLSLLEGAGDVEGADETLSPPGAPWRERLGEYRLLREVGRGGMGVVYEAVQDPLGRRVALKVLPPQATLDPRFLERFRREAKAAAGLQHEGIVPVFGVGEDDGVSYYAMQFVEGRSLDRVLAELRAWRAGGGPSPLEAAGAGGSSSTGSAGRVGGGSHGLERHHRAVARLGLQVAEALAHAHEHGVLHRDVKPSNLLVDEHGKIWVTDFGLAKEEGSADLTQSGDVVGTLRYLAPERLSGRSDARADVYALGMVLYELLTLRPAFDEGDRAQLLKSVALRTPTRPRRIDGRIPRDLESIVLAATEKLPELRYATARELAADLSAFLDRRPISARPLHPLHLLRLAVGRNKPLATAVGLAGVALVVATVVYVTGLRSARDDTRAALEGMRMMGLVSASETALDTDPMLGLMLAREAFLVERRPETFSQLHAAVCAVPPMVDLGGHGGAVHSIEFAPDGASVLTACEDGRARLWSREGQLLLELEPAEPVYAARFFDGGELLLTAASDAVRIWDREGEVLDELHVPRTGNGEYWLAVAPDEDRLLFGFASGESRLVDMTGEVLLSLPRQPGPVRHVAFSPDGRRLLTAVGYGRDHTPPEDVEPPVSVWTSAGELVARTHHGDNVLTACFSSDGRRVLSASYDGTAKILVVEEDRTVVLPLTSFGNGAAFSGDGRLVATCTSDGKVQVWDDEGRRLVTLPAGRSNPARHATFDRAAERVVTVSIEGEVRLFDLEGVELSSFRVGGVGRVASSPDGRHFAGTVTLPGGGSGVRLWEAWDSELLFPTGHRESVLVAKRSPADGRLLTASWDGTARLWDDGGERIAELVGHDDSLFDADLSPDGGTIATASWDRSVGLWDTDGRLRTRIPALGRCQTVEFSPDGGRLLTTEGGNVVVRDRSGELRMTGPRGNRATFTPDGRAILAGGEDGLVQLLAADDGEVLATFEGLARKVWSVAVSPDGARLLAGDGGGSACLWTREGALAGRLEGHTGSIDAVAFRPDGSGASPEPGVPELVTASRDGTLRLWTREGELVAVLRGHRGEVRCAEFTPDGSRVISSGYDQTVRTWILSPDELLATAERRIRRRFGADELERYAELLADE